MADLKDYRIAYGTMEGHIIPSSNAAFDLGNAEYKIRHLFLSDNSIWIGDTGFGAKSDKGKRKRKKLHTLSSSVPGNPYRFNSFLNSQNSSEQTKFHDRFSALAVGAEVEVVDPVDPLTMSGSYTFATYTAEDGGTPAYITLTPASVGVDDAVAFNAEVQINVNTNLVEEDGEGNVTLSVETAKIFLGASDRCLSSDGDKDLTWNGAKIAGGSATFEGLTDTDITSPTDGDLAFYDQTSAKWINRTVSGDVTFVGSGAATLADDSVGADEIDEQSTPTISGYCLRAQVDSSTISTGDPVQITGYDSNGVKVDLYSSGVQLPMMGVAKSGGSAGEFIDVQVRGIVDAYVIVDYGDTAAGSVMGPSSVDNTALQYSSYSNAGQRVGFLLETVPGNSGSQEKSSTTYKIWVQPG